MRQLVERKIASALIRDGLFAGYSISVDIDSGRECVLEKSINRKEILNAMFSVDEEFLIFYKDNKQVGWVFFVYGNDGWDVISDYTVNLEHIMGNANKLSERYA